MTRVKLTTEEVAEREAAQRRRRYEKYKAAGLCVRCGKPAVEGILLCQKCRQKNKESFSRYRPKISEEARERQKEYQKERRRRLKAAGICVKCGKHPAAEGKTLCQECRKKDHASTSKPKLTPEEKAEKRRLAWKRRRDKWKAAGLCTKCGKRPQEDGILFCAKCREKDCERQRKAWASHPKTPKPVRERKPPAPKQRKLTSYEQSVALEILAAVERLGG